MKMNIYVMIVSVILYAIVSVSASRGKSAKEKYLRVLDRLEANRAKPEDPNVGQRRHPRNPGGTPPPPKETTTTKSPEEIEKENNAKKEAQNPKRVPNLDAKQDGGDKGTNDVDKAVREFGEDLMKKYNKVCRTNDDCSNNTCCMVTSTKEEGFCQEPPVKKNKRCSEFCKCGDDKLECKVKELSDGQIFNKCVLKLDPEPVDPNLAEKYKNGKFGLQPNTPKRVARAFSPRLDKLA